MRSEESARDKHMAENEVFFREHNEIVQREFAEHKHLADADNTSTILPTTGTFNFYCECADEKCTKRIALTLRQYADIHKFRDHFVIAPDHDVSEIEDVIQQTAKYMVVRKHIQPPDSTGKLNPTNLDNQ